MHRSTAVYDRSARFRIGHARRLMAVTLIFLAAALGCSRDEKEASMPTDASSDQAVGYAAPEPMALSRRALAGEELASAARVRPEELPTMPQSAEQPGQMLIRNGNLMIRVDSLDLAVDAVRRLAASLGGIVGNVSVSTGEHEVRSATLELRIPSQRFDSAMGGMAPIGKVEHSSTSVQDVGEEFVDVSARIANAKRLEARLVQLLATRTGKLEDVLAVERELARVREEIERREGRLRFLSARVAMSTINVTVSEPAPVVGNTPGQGVLGAAFIGAWRNFVGLVAWAIESLGVLIPLALIAWAALRLLRRKRSRTSAV